MVEEQPDRASGGVPHAYRNALFWRWVPSMPAALPSAFVTLLYALGAAADTGGKLKFRDGKSIRIKDIAAAVKADEKDVRRYMTAAIAAGVVAVQGERRRGLAARYVLILAPRPDWDAAAASLERSKRKRSERKPPPWRVPENGGPPPGPENGGPPPVLPEQHAEAERGTAPHTGSGDRPPFGSGDRPPNNPGIAKELPQDMADAGGQPQDARARGPEGIDQDDQEPGFVLCAVCSGRMLPLRGRTTHRHCATPSGAVSPLPVPTEGTAS